MSNIDTHKKQFIKIFNELVRSGYRYNRLEAFQDFAKISAIALSNQVDRYFAPAIFEEREKFYYQLEDKYGKEGMDLIKDLFSIVCQFFSTEINDFLGELYMDLELGNKDSGQFFTPFSVSYLMASLITNPEEIVTKDEITLISDPTIGASSTILGTIKVLQEYENLNPGSNFREKFCIYGTDIDKTSIHMSYIQLSLLSIPAVLVHGNSLSLEEWDHFYTPIFKINRWSEKIHQFNNDKNHSEILHSGMAKNDEYQQQVLNF